jgi:hypothetical protein
MITLDEVRPLSFAIDTVDVSGSSVELGATTLAALENITVDGTVELGATTLAALESVTVQNGAGASAVNIQDGGNSITVDGTVELGATSLAALETITTIEGGFANWKATAHAVSTTASQIASTPLTGRVSITLQNLGSADVYIGSTNAVTAITGTKLAKFSSFSEKLSDGAAIWVLSAAGSADLRVSEFAI